MTYIFRRLLATLAATFAFALPAGATTYSIDYSDLWWTAGESGWGMNIIQQYDTLFTTLYVYGPDNQPRWYFASGMTGSQNSYTGGFFRTTGPVFSTNPFPSSQVGVIPVGTITINFNSAVTGTMTYTIDGTQVTKQITRNTFASNSLTGRYLGGMVANTSSCSNPVNNVGALIYGDLAVAQTGSAVTMRVDFLNNNNQAQACFFNGTYAPQGRIGTISQGTWSCSLNGNTVNSGTFTMTQVDTSINSMSAVFSGSDQFCQYDGRFGGLRDVL